MNNKTGSKALNAAAGCGTEECVKVLLKAGAHVGNTNGSKALINAVHSESVDCVNMLLQAGADVNAVHQDYLFTTALFAATTIGSF